MHMNTFKNYDEGTEYLDDDFIDEGVSFEKIKRSSEKKKFDLLKDKYRKKSLREHRIGKDKISEAFN